MRFGGWRVMVLLLQPALTKQYRSCKLSQSLVTRTLNCCLASGNTGTTCPPTTLLMQCSPKLSPPC